MARRCDREVYNVVRDVIGESEAKEIVNELKERAIRRVKLKDETIYEALAAVKKQMEEEEIRASKVRKRNAYLSAITRHNILKTLERFENPITALESLLDGVQSNISGSRLSTVALQKSHVRKVLTSMWSDFERFDLVSTFHNPDNTVELVNEMFEEGTSKNLKIKLLAQVINKHQEGIVKELNKYGADIAIRSDYIARQSHNRLKMTHSSESAAERVRDWFDAKGDPVVIRNKAFQRWKNTILPLLDLEKTFKFGDVEKMLRLDFDAMTTGIRLDRTASTEALESVIDVGRLGYSDKINLAKQISQSRSYIFKDGASWLEYNKVYGNSDFKTALVKGIEAGCDNLGLLKVWGPNPESNFEWALKEVAMKHRNNPSVLNKLKGVENIFMQVTGKSNIAVNPRAAKISSATRRWQNITKLGSTVLKSLPDFLAHAMTLRFNGIGFFDSYAKSFGSILTGWADKDRKQIAELIGVGADHMLTNIASRVSAEDMEPGVLSSLEQMLFKLNLMHRWDDAHRKGAAASLSRWLAMNKDLEFSQLNDKLKNSLRIYGIEDKEWSIISKSIMKPSPGSREFISPGLLQNSTKRDVGKFLGKPTINVTDKDMEFVRSNVEEKLRAYFYDQLDHVVLNPRPSDRALILGSTQPGTVWGEAARFFAQFKMYSIAFYRRILKREIDGTFDGKASISNLIEIVIGATALGYLSNAASDFANNKTPGPINYKTILRAIETGGGLGILGDLLFGDYGKYGRGLLTSIFGPVPGTASDIVTLLAKSRDLDDPSSNAFYLAKSNIPFANLFYLKTPLNLMIFNGIQDRISPGYTRRMVNRVEKEGQHFIFNPR